MAFWNSRTLKLEAFRPGIRSKAEIGESLVMVTMQIDPAEQDTGHQHAFDQCGIVIEGQIEMFVGEERLLLQPEDCYFIPAGIWHGWKTFDLPVKILDISPKQPG